MLIRKDEFGLYIQSRDGAGKAPYKPGGDEPRYDMTDGGLKEGDKPKSRHCNGSPYVKITMDNGTVLHWQSTDTYGHPLYGK